MLTYSKNPSSNYFTGNPVVFSLSSDQGESIRFSITCMNVPVYSGIILPAGSGGAYSASIDISDVLQTCFDDYSIADPPAIISDVNNFALPVSVQFNQNNSTLNYSGKVYRGGISRLAMRLLEENGTDFFDFRLKNYIRNFLFTTRTNEREIYIRKTEIAPFIFIHPGKAITFRIGELEIQTPLKEAGVICAMNLAPVLDQYADAGRIDVWVNEELSFRFRIELEKPSLERYRIRFRNSLGCFEVLEVTGRAEHEPEFKEENLYNTITPAFFYEEKRSRTATQDVTVVQTGYRRREEIPFLFDMIKSDEIYFTTPDGASFRCHVSCSEMKYRERITEPGSFSLTVKKTTVEEFVTPSIPSDIINWDRIFDEGFDVEFD